MSWKTEHERTRLLSASLKVQNKTVKEFTKSLRADRTQIGKYIRNFYSTDRPHWDRAIDEEIEKGKKIFNEYCEGL